MLQEQTVVTSSAMTGYEPGIKAKRAIIRELARRAAAGEKSPTMRELGKASGKSWRQARRHLNELREAGLIDWTTTKGRDGARVTMTDCGRMAGELIEDL